MDTKHIYDEYFLGANTPEGFWTLFERSYDADGGWRVWIIKGGPGTGKSTAMRAVSRRAAELGLYHERCLCSSDPDSLDAVIVPELKRAVYDGTAPHVLEPKLAGACENIVNFGAAWNSARLYGLRNEIADAGAKCAACHNSAKLWLRAADAFRRNTMELAKGAADRTKIDRAVKNIRRKLFAGASGDGGIASYRLFSAVTPRGVIFPGEERFRAADRMVIDDPVGVPAALLLEGLSDSLKEDGISFTAGLCSQTHRLEHIYMPKRSLLISVSNSVHTAKGSMRGIHCARFLPPDLIKEHRMRLRLNSAGVSDMTARACAEMARAKSAHDRLESLYAQAMDYSITQEITDALVREFFA